MSEATLADQLRSTIAERIICGEMPPGMRLDEKDLAAQFGVSRTPLREAFKALAAAGLVEQRPHRGVVVSLPSNRRIEEMFEVMGEIEATCARLAAQRMTAAERRGLDTMHLQALKLVHGGALDAYAAFNNEFHDFIYRASKNSFLEETARSVRQRLMPFRRTQFRVIGRLSRSHAEHDAVVQAILQGDGAAAEAAMRSHVSKVTIASVGLVDEHRPAAEEIVPATTPAGVDSPAIRQSP